MTRDELIEKIDITKKAIMFAGPVHRRDLRKHLKRMLAQRGSMTGFRRPRSKEWDKWPRRRRRL